MTVKQDSTNSTIAKLQAYIAELKIKAANDDEKARREIKEWQRIAREAK